VKGEQRNAEGIYGQVPEVFNADGTLLMLRAPYGTSHLQAQGSAYIKDLDAFDSARFATQHTLDAGVDDRPLFLLLLVLLAAVYVHRTTLRLFPWLVQQTVVLAQYDRCMCLKRQHMLAKKTTLLVLSYFLVMLCPEQFAGKVQLWNH
jgi:hypothetical protein